MKRIGIFGGTFNPPHLAHLKITSYVKSRLRLDKIIIIPSAVPPLKKKENVIEIKHRLAMVKIAFGRKKNFVISDIEIKNPNMKSYTIDTLLKLHDIYKKKQVIFYLILGLDSIIDFPKWKKPDKIFSLAKIVIISRPGYNKNDIKPEYSEKVIFLEMPLMNISSSDIRKRVKEKKTIKKLVTPKIEKYIIKNNLYK